MPSTTQTPVATKQLQCPNQTILSNVPPSYLRYPPSSSQYLTWNVRQHPTAISKQPEQPEQKCSARL